MDRASRLPENAAVELLTRARRYLQERKTSSQPVGTHNVRYALTSAGNPAWSGTLPASPTPGVGVKILRLTVTAQNQDDLFCRLITRLDVGTDGNWYRLSNRLADIKASTTPFGITVMPDVQFGLTRNTKSFLIVIDGQLSTPCYARFWVAANDDVSTNVVAVN